MSDDRADQTLKDLDKIAEQQHTSVVVAGSRTPLLEKSPSVSASAAMEVGLESVDGRRSSTLSQQETTVHCPQRRPSLTVTHVVDGNDIDDDPMVLHQQQHQQHQQQQADEDLDLDETMEEPYRSPSATTNSTSAHGQRSSTSPRRSNSVGASLSGDVMDSQSVSGALRARSGPGGSSRSSHRSSSSSIHGSHTSSIDEDQDDDKDDDKDDETEHSQRNDRPSLQDLERRDSGSLEFEEIALDFQQQQQKHQRQQGQEHNSQQQQQRPSSTSEDERRPRRRSSLMGAFLPTSLLPHSSSIESTVSSSASVHNQKSGIFAFHRQRAQRPSQNTRLFSSSIENLARLVAATAEREEAEAQQRAKEQSELGTTTATGASTTTTTTISSYSSFSSTAATATAPAATVSTELLMRKNVGLNIGTDAGPFVNVDYQEQAGIFAKNNMTSPKSIESPPMQAFAAAGTIKVTVSK